MFKVSNSNDWSLLVTVEHQSNNQRHGSYVPPVRILFEDNHLLVVQKPPNVPSQADRTGDPDMLSLLKADLKERYMKPGRVFLGLVHRLDRPVGGVMVFAKTSKAAARLSDQIRRRTFAKRYVAVVAGCPRQHTGRLEHHLVKIEDENRVVIADHAGTDTKRACLDYEVLEAQESLSLVRIHLLTGRRHQIRVQLASLGCPIVGDRKYGTPTERYDQPVALWAVEIELDHPTLRERMTFGCGPPAVWPWNVFDTPAD